MLTVFVLSMWAAGGVHVLEQTAFATYGACYEALLAEIDKNPARIDRHKIHAGECIEVHVDIGQIGG